MPGWSAYSCDVQFQETLPLIQPLWTMIASNSSGNCEQNLTSNYFWGRQTLDTYLDSGVNSLCIHEVVLHGVLRDFLGTTEDPLPKDELAVPTPQSRRVGGPVRHGRVLGHGHGAPLVSLPL